MFAIEHAALLAQLFKAELVLLHAERHWEKIVHCFEMRAGSPVILHKGSKKIVKTLLQRST